MVGRQVPAHGGQHDTGFQDHRGGSDEAPLGLERHRVERDEERDIGQPGAGDEPLDERHRGNEEEDAHRCPAPEDERQGQARHEPQAGARRLTLNDPARAEDEQRQRQDQVDEGGVASVEGAEPLPNGPGPVVLTMARDAGGGATPCAPGPEPLGVQVTRAGSHRILRFRAGRPA